MSPNLKRLTDRETAVLARLTNGETNKEIARSLDITEATTKVHVKAIFRKLGVRNRVEAAVLNSQLRAIVGELEQQRREAA